MMQFRIFFSLLLVIMLFGSMPVYADDSESPLFTKLSLDLNNLNPAWWEGFTDSSAADKERFFNGLELEYQRLFAKSLKDSPEALLIRQLTASLQQASSKAPKDVVRQEVRERYSITEWLEILRAQRRLSQEQNETRQNLQQNVEAINLHKKEIASLLLRYRDLSAQDAEKIPVALLILRHQLEFLVARSLEALNKKQSVVNEDAYIFTENLAEAAADRLDGTPEQIAELETQAQRYRSELETLTNQQSLNRIIQLKQDASNVDSKAAIEKITLATSLINARVNLLFIEMQKLVLLLVTESEHELAPLSETVSEQVPAEIVRQRSQLNRVQEQVLGEASLGDRQRYEFIKELQKSRKELEQSQLLLQETLLIKAHAQRLYHQQKPWWESPVSGAVQLWKTSGTLLVSWVNYPLFTISESPVSLFDILWVILIITVAAFISRQLRALLIRIGTTQQTFSDAAVYTLGRILHYVIMTVAVVVGLSSIGLDLSNVALVAGALSVGIGFGLQSIFNNFISGLILLFERPFRIGDLVELESGVRGRIRSINVRSTHINTWDNIDVLVPNSEFIGGRVTNYTLSDDVRRLHIPFGVAYGSDKELVKKAALEAANKVEYTLNEPKRQPEVWLVSFGESSLDFELIIWMHHNRMPAGHNAFTNYLWELETAFAKYGIEIPFPQRDLHLRTADEKIIAEIKSPRPLMNEESRQ